MIDKVIQSTTQQFLDIYDITNDLVILKDGTTSLIITVDAMNFGLLAEEEQDGVMYAYASLLNSLNYPIQIVIHSQTKDVTGYLLLLREQEEIAQNKLMRQRIRAYREFVGNLIHDRNVLDKKFYVCIPASPIELGILPAASVMPGSKPFDISTIEKNVILDKARNILEPKRDHLISLFGRIGLYSRQLSSQEIIQFFYVSYNPEAAEGQQLADSSNYTTPLVTAGIEGSPMNTLPTTAPTPGVQPTTPAPAQTPQTPTTTVVTTPENTTMTPPAMAPSNSGYQPTQMPAREPAPTPTTTTPPANVAATTPVNVSPTIPPMPAAPSTPTSPTEIPATPATTPSTPTPEGEVQAAINQTLTEVTPPATTTSAPAPQTLPEI